VVTEYMEWGRGGWHSVNLNSRFARGCLMIVNGQEGGHWRLHYLVGLISDGGAAQ